MFVAKRVCLMENPDPLMIEAALLNGIKSGCNDDVIELLPKVENINILYPDGDSLLTKALRYYTPDRQQLISELLKKGIIVNHSNATGMTPLHWAAKYAGAVEVRELLSHGANVNVTNNGGCTPLHLCLFFCYNEVDKIRELLINGADLTVLYHKETALMAAVRCNSKQVVELLIQFGADPDFINEDGFSALHKMCLNHEVTCTPYVVSLLPKMAPKRQRDRGIVKILLKSKANINFQSPSGLTPLHVAVRLCDMEAIADLLKFEAKVDMQDKYGRTPLHYACVIVDDGAKALKILIEYNADMNIPDLKGKSPLYKSFSLRRIEIIEILLVAGATFNFESFVKELLRMTKLRMFVYDFARALKLIIRFQFIQNSTRIQVAYDETQSAPVMGMLQQFNGLYPGEHFVEYIENCMREVTKMRRRILHRKVNMWEFIMCRKTHAHPVIAKRLLSIMVNRPLPIYNDAIFGKLGKRFLRNHLMSATVFYVSETTKEAVFINSDIVSKVTEYLEIDDIVSLLQVFHRFSGKFDAVVKLAKSWK